MLTLVNPLTQQVLLVTNACGPRNDDGTFSDDNDCSGGGGVGRNIDEDIAVSRTRREAYKRARKASSDASTEVAMFAVTRSRADYVRALAAATKAREENLKAMRIHRPGYQEFNQLEHESHSWLNAIVDLEQQEPPPEEDQEFDDGRRAIIDLRAEALKRGNSDRAAELDRQMDTLWERYNKKKRGW